MREMIIIKWDVASFTTVQVLLAIAIICYTAVLCKIRGITYNDLFVTLTVMLMVS